MKNNIRQAAAGIIMVTLAHSGAIAQTVNRAPASSGLVTSTELGASSTAIEAKDAAAKPKAPAAQGLQASESVANSSSAVQKKPSAATVFGGVGTPMPQAGETAKTGPTGTAAIDKTVKKDDKK
jgi:hypothetical protein